MGLETVELVIAVEEEFGIEIPDIQAEKMATVGDLIDFVYACYSRSEQAMCRTAEVFYETRSALGEFLRKPPRCIRLATTLKEIVPRCTRRGLWKALAQRGLQVPRLALPVFVRRMGMIAALAAATALFLTCLVLIPSEGLLGAVSIFTVFMLVFLLGLLVVIPLTLVILEPLRKEMPSHLATVGDLARAICVRRGIPVSPVPHAAGTPMRHAIALRVGMIVAKQLAVPLEAVTEEKRFREDFGI